MSIPWRPADSALNNCMNTPSEQRIRKIVRGAWLQNPNDCATFIFVTNIAP